LAFPEDGPGKSMESLKEHAEHGHMWGWGQKPVISCRFSASCTFTCYFHCSIILYFGTKLNVGSREMP
jgi:hypothetical protein